jgi:hypothetical protein
MTDPAAFGRRWLTSTRNLDAPAAYAASTYSRDCSEATVARTTRATLGQRSAPNQSP